MCANHKALFSDASCCPEGLRYSALLPHHWSNYTWVPLQTTSKPAIPHNIHIMNCKHSKRKERKMTVCPHFKWFQPSWSILLDHSAKYYIEAREAWPPMHSHLYKSDICLIPWKRIVILPVWLYGFYNLYNTANYSVSFGNCMMIEGMDVCYDLLVQLNAPRKAHITNSLHVCRAILSEWPFSNN